MNMVQFEGHVMDITQVDKNKYFCLSLVPYLTTSFLNPLFV